jgi:hypothetical protein
MEDFADRYGSHFAKLVDSGASGKVFVFDQVLLMPTAAGYRALVEQAQVEITPRIMKFFIDSCNGGRSSCNVCHTTSMSTPK